DKVMIPGHDLREPPTLRPPTVSILAHADDGLASVAGHDAEGIGTGLEYDSLGEEVHALHARIERQRDVERGGPVLAEERLAPFPPTCDEWLDPRAGVEAAAMLCCHTHHRKRSTTSLLPAAIPSAVASAILSSCAVSLPTKSGGTSMRK